jgi:hypothetical protein
LIRDRLFWATVFLTVLANAVLLGSAHFAEPAMRWTMRAQIVD